MPKIQIDTKKILKFLPLVIVLSLSLGLYFFGNPEYIVEKIGLENAYGLMFIFALLGGLTTFNTVPYYSLLLVLATAGLEPFYLGLSSALGVMSGDTFSYILGRQGGAVLPAKFYKYIENLKIYAENNEKKFLFICFIYCSLSPLSNDFITISAGMAKIKYWKMMLPLALGNIVFNVSLAYLFTYATDFFTGLVG